ncbi:hypothetical protein EYW49_04190 [Siculibacillus lacustris]|uniref:Uncharacterized protein n=1 Tax=Siculibacillus lacustris TaxID=1549641 RepID=A0A4Q9VWW7_9HYPH|nr:hypothetical protein [Siculibacillus lacustris]TBW40391.1 hypothetical protein EYW49_04190 [Siculibacillus lacustris]
MSNPFDPMDGERDGGPDEERPVAPVPTGEPGTLVEGAAEAAEDDAAEAVEAAKDAIEKAGAVL